MCLLSLYYTPQSMAAFVEVSGDAMLAHCRKGRKMIVHVGTLWEVGERICVEY